MATILFTYEFGGGLGHLNRLIAVARRLDISHRFVFALPDMALGASALERAFGSAVEARRGIAWPGPTDPAASRVPTHTFADVIRLFGFADAARLRAMATRWRDLLDDVRPDLVVADFAPTLRLVAGGSIPTVVVGNGYTVPPSGRPLPPIRSWEAAPPNASLDAERELLAAANAVRHRFGGGAFAHFADLFSGESTFACTLPMFDPYCRWREGGTTWPFNLPRIAPGPAAAAARAGPTVFVYMAASHPGFATVLRVLNGLRAPAHLYVAGTDPRALATRCARHIGILTRPADFAQVLPQVRVLVHHAGLGTAYAGMAAGTPQLVLPLNLEHLITARGLVAAEVAQGFPASTGFDEAEIRAALTSLIDDPAWIGRAAARAARLVECRDQDPLEAVVAACGRLLARSCRPPP